MAINLQKVKKRFTGISNSWTDFYFNMALEMAENVAKAKVGALANRFNLLEFTGDVESVLNINDNYWFAHSLTEEYDKVVKGGKTIIGGRSVQFGNTVGMQAALMVILQNTQLSKTGSLLRDIGPAIQIYWTGAVISPILPPTIPCIGALANTKTLLAVNFSPGVWTRIEVRPVNSISPFLFNFILSASVHLLTVGGIYTCLCQYPPPAPPAPGILPWAGYFIKPFSGNPISSLDWENVKSLAAGTILTAALDDSGEIDLSASNLATQLIKGFIEGGELQEPQIKLALNSIIGGDEPAMAAAGTAISGNRG